MEADDIKRAAVPEPKQDVRTFIGLVLNIAKLCKIQKVPEIEHQVDLLVRAAETYLWTKEHGGNPMREGEEKRRFIAVFKNRFRIVNDYDYPSMVTPVELKMIEQTINNKLKTEHVDSDYFLAFLFDDFLVRKPNFNPANIKLACSQVVWEDFKYTNKENLKEKKEQALQESEAVNLVNRAREALRRTEDADLKTKITESLKKYRDGGIILAEFRKQILELEKISRQVQGE
jgi:hypothetical protein